MRRLLLFISFIIFLVSLSSFTAKQLKEQEMLKPIENIKSEMLTLKENIIIPTAIHQFVNEINEYLVTIEDTIDIFPHAEDIQKSTKIEKPQLTTPTDQVFSINNIELGDYKTDVENLMGIAKRTTRNEYGTDWYTYHKDYQLFCMVTYDENERVVGLYTNQDLIASTYGITYGSTKEMVVKQLGEPLTEIRKGMVFYKFEDDADYDIFLIDKQYVTFFYDKHQDNIVTSILIIDSKLEHNKPTFYTKPSPSLIEGFEYQLFDLVNSTRVTHGLELLTWDPLVKDTARKHSEDMAIHQYFNHTNLKGQSPFDRMLVDGIPYSIAGENLAAGQQNSIFAHEGLMNSWGHRENILHDEFQFLGVGVAVNSEHQPYFTENFYSK